ncbi:hypothetical protein ACFTSD_01460 [Nocardiaceae bacterium NPDC056970]
MTATVLVECPVCRRRIETTASTGRMWKHRDKADIYCPMSGHHIDFEEAA